MKKIVLIGPSGGGKSTLIKYLEDERQEVRKTIVPEYHANILDTPGEYIEHKVYYGNLQVIICDYEFVGLVIACDSDNIYIPPHITQMFLGKLCIGIVSKIDLGTEKDIKRCKDQLIQAGVEEIFYISIKDMDSIEKLRTRLFGKKI